MSKTREDYNHQVSFKDHDEIEVALDMPIKKIYPGLPTWLSRLDFNKTESEFTDLNQEEFWKLKVQFDEFIEAEQEYAAAYSIACKYETGAIQGGINSAEATRWFIYAAVSGSPYAAIRLFHILEDALYLKLALQNAGKILNQQRNANSDIDDLLKLVATASAQLLTLYANDDTTLRTIELVLHHRRFKNMPADSSELLVKQYQLFLARGNKIKSHLVVKQLLVDEGDFKVGVYKNLNIRLPLVSIATHLYSNKCILDSEFPWFKAANNEVFKQLNARVLSGAPEFKIRPLLLTGPPGTGKTSWAKRMADLFKVPFSLVMAGGSSDSMHLKGLARGWSSSRPGAVARVIASESIANPIFIVDEIDKVGTSNNNGSILDVLLQLVEPATNLNYLDECLQVPCDFSWVSWIATCNQLSILPKPLLDRFTVIHIAKPSIDHAQTIINGALKNYAIELGVDARMLPSISIEQIEILKKLTPREINKVVRMMIENQLVEKVQMAMH